MRSGRAGLWLAKNGRGGLGLPELGLRTTPGFNGDYHKALKSIRAKTLIVAGTGDLLNPEYEATEAAHYIADVRYLPINDQRSLGHLSGAGATAAENELQNAAIAGFLDIVTDRGGKIQGP